MAAKNTLKYKRNRLPPLLVIVDELIHTCLRAIASPDFKATISDFIRLIRLRLKWDPIKPATTARWLDHVSGTIPIRT
ncbi:MAG: hypothetical protein ABSG41_16780 [Bryobacteraceae bacterium]|jgi:hypothetical protein